ncbi:hypothetical protein Apa02nite_079770 [Actinoplanes palleronii]|uniref:Uncharacterized protein n=1 Tax=Actinoplanes palleronii TaxID=113570 RepID=A0ABQ4BMH6_9ACTN|nr:hypothetical protein Apa02nite_079770 [Actinoplanes palleronii]
MLPVHANQKAGGAQGSLDPVLEPGTFAVDPLPLGPPRRRWDELGAGEAEALGWYAPRPGISGGPAGHVLLAPGDVHGAVIDLALVLDSRCCGVAGDVPNMVCAACRAPVAIRIDDCGLWQAVWLDPVATRVIEDGPGPYPVLGWTDLLAQRPGLAPSEPYGGWHPIWTAAVASALAHVLAASGGAPILIPDHRVAAIFRPVLDRLGPAGTGPERTLVLAGPGLLAVEGDVVLVPEHPQTGELWPVAPPATPIPLAWEVWRHLAFYRDPKPVGRSVPMLPEALPEQIPGYRLMPDGQIFLGVLSRLPEVRQPWLRAVYDRGRSYSYAYLAF